MARKNRPTLSPPRKNRSDSRPLLAIAAWVSRVAAVVLILALAFTLFETLSGSLKDYPSGFTAQAAARLIANTHHAGRALVAASAALAVAGLILLWGWAPAIWAGAALGVIFYVGLPYFCVPHVSAASLSSGPHPQPAWIVVQAWRNSGMAFFAAGGLMFLAWAWEQLAISLSTSRRSAGGLKIPFYSACWQTTYCKPEVRHLCAPGRTGFRKSCWRHKSGCFCDESIGDRMLDAARRRAGKEGAEFFGPRAKAPSPTLADRLRSTHHRVQGQGIACADCPIYNLHQLQKHRIAAPLLLLGTPALVYYYGGAVRAGYARFVAALDAFALHLGFNEAGTRILTNQIHGAFGEPIVEYLIYLLMIILLITLGARLLEWWCFEVKL